MLPTTGHFKVINCPFFEACICERPYCHFKHSKKETGKDEDQVLSELVSQAVHKVLKPEKGETTQSVAINENLTTTESVELPAADCKKVTYNPTPISELNKIKSGSSTNTNGSSSTVIEEKKSKRHIPIQYTPQRPHTSQNRTSNNSPTRLEKLKAQKYYNPTCKYNNEEINYIPSSIKSLLSDNGSNDINAESYIPSTSNKSDQVASFSYNPTLIPQTSKADSTSSLPYDPAEGTEKFGYDPTSVIKEETLESIIYNPTIISLKEETTSGSFNNKPYKCHLEYSPAGKKSETTLAYNPTKKSESSKEKTDNEYVPSPVDQVKIENTKQLDKETEDFVSDFLNDADVKNSDVNKSNNSEEDLSKKSVEQNCDKVTEKSKSSKHKEKKDECINGTKHIKSSSKKHSRLGDNKNKIKNKTSDQTTNSEKSVDSAKKHKHDSNKSKVKKTNEKDTSNKTSSDKIKKSKHEHSGHSKSKNKESSEKSKRRSSKDDKDHKSSRSKHTSHKKEHKNHSSKDSKHSSKSSSQERTSSAPSQNTCSSFEQALEEANSSFSLSAVEIGMLDDDDFYGFDSDDSSAALEECKRIFEEYQPPAKEEKVVPQVQAEEEVAPAARKRIAHEGKKRIFPTPSAIPQKRRLVESPAQVMAKRYAMMRKAQKENLPGEAIDSDKKEGNLFASPTESLMVATSVPTGKKSVTVPSATAATTGVQKGRARTNEQPSTSGIKRIAGVPNVTSLINAKKKVEELMKEKMQSQLQKTPSQSLPKGGKRVSHTPVQTPLVDLPMVLQADRSRLPINVRTRYLEMMAKECAKLYTNKDSIYERALNEELNCYTRCHVLVSYRNSAMLAVNRLRKEAEGNSSKSDSSSNISIKRRQQCDYAAELTGSRLYNNITRWLLTTTELEQNGFPLPGATLKGHAVFKDMKHYELLETNTKRCARCKKIYAVDDDGFAINKEDCVYHPCGRFTYRGETKFICCKAPASIEGCLTANTHVFDSGDPAAVGGYVTTLEPNGPNDERSQSVYALDCEMVYTTLGMELARVTVVNDKCDTVYESLVQPFGAVLDYNTRFSGLTEEQLLNVTKNIIDVQATLLHMFNSKTILIGHSLESDLKTLRIIHGTIIDTSVLFPHKYGPPKKRALRTLATDYLQKIIQNSESGHDSAEDAITCMELIIWKLKEELKSR